MEKTGNIISSRRCHHHETDSRTDINRRPGVARNKINKTCHGSSGKLNSRTGSDVSVRAASPAPSQEPSARPGSGSSLSTVVISRPASSQFLSRAGSRLSARIQGFPAPIKRTISRVSRRSRPASSASAARADSEPISTQDLIRQGSDADVRQLLPVSEFGVRPFDGAAFDLAWDTDLEIEASADPFDSTGRTVYIEACRQQGVIPASYFLRHMRNTTLDMKHHGLGPTGVKPLAVALVSNTYILNLNLRDNWLGNSGGISVCDMLMENCYITDLDLSDNKLGLEFVTYFTNVISQNSTLTHVSLSGNNFGDGCAYQLAEIIAGSGLLEYLDLSHNQLGATAGLALGPAIADNISIRELDLSWNSIRRKGAEAIAKGIKQNVTLEKVNLSWNGFGTDGATALGDALKVNTSIHTLDIQNNRLTAEASVLFGKGLSVNETLRTLWMGKNPMQSAGCYAICAALLKNPGSVMNNLDFTDILVNSDFDRLLTQLKVNLPELKVRIGSELPKKPKVRAHPMVKLQHYINKHQLRLVDFFNRFDKDGSMSVTREEFAQGIEETGIKLTEDEVNLLLDELDKDGDGEINYSEMVLGHQDFTEKEKKMANQILNMGR